MAGGAKIERKQSLSCKSDWNTRWLPTHPSVVILSLLYCCSYYLLSVYGSDTIYRVVQKVIPLF